MKRDATSKGLQSLLLFSTFWILGASAQKVSFPGPKSETRSPDGRYAIRNVDDEEAQPPHSLTLIDSSSGKQYKIRDYGRHVEVLWSPASDAFIVNDFEGSDSTRPILYPLPWRDEEIDLLKELTDFLRTRGEEKLVLQNDHVYLSVNRWLNSREVLCRLEAYGEASPHGSGFEGNYVYKLGKGFRTENSRTP